MEHKQVYSVHEAKTHLSRLIQAAINGHEVLIGHHHHALVKLSALTTKKKTLGFFEGKGSIAEDFNAPLDDFNGY